MFSLIEIANFTRENKYAKSFMSCIGRGLCRILSTWMVFGDTRLEGENFGKSAPFYFCLNMKKFFTLIVLCVFSLCTIHAEITWTLSDDGTLTISGTDMPNYALGIGSPWYSQRKKIKKVVIKDGVTSIGDYAFEYCSSLTSITIPNSVMSIGEYAFRGCSGLTSVTIPNSVTSIGNKAFLNCSGLTSVTIPSSVSHIGYETFMNCSGLTSVTIPNSVTSIGYEAFAGCSGLTSVTIPNSVTSIGNYAFYRCSGLTSLTIPNSVTSIEYSAFSGCKALTSINLPNSVTSIGEGAFAGCSGLTSVTIPNSVTSIGYEAFAGCSGLTSVTIPNSVTSIGVSAFKNCSGLTSVTIGNSVTSIESDTFMGCSGLTSITVDKGNSYYDSRDNSNAIIETKSNTLIIGCKNTIIPNSVTRIGFSAFRNCSGLTSVTIPNSVTSIGGSAFNNCSGLTSLTIPESVTSIEGSAFDGAKLRNIVVKAKTPPTSGGKVFSVQSYYHTTLLIPEGSWDAYAYSDNWYQFINIREVAYNAVNLTNSKAYMLKSSNEGSYLFYDSVNDCVAALNETALDDTEENNTWMTTEVDGKHYVYNLGAKKFLVADKTNSKTGYSLSDVPASIDIEDGKDAIVFGKSKEFYMVINDKLNVDENLESQIIATTGIKGISVDANQPTVTYSVNGQVIPNDTKGLHIKNGKKVIVK